MTQRWLIFTLVLTGFAGESARSSPPDSSKPSSAIQEARYLSNITQLTDTAMGFVNAGEAYFSPDQESVIFQATPVGQDDYQIYILNLKTRKPLRVSTGRGGCTCAFFRPDGKKIIFASSHLRPETPTSTNTDNDGSYTWDFDSHMDIFEADPDGSHLKRLTDSPGYDAEGAYSPDGKRIVFTSQRDGDLEVYIMNADGSGQRRLTHAPGYDGGPFVSPDGTLILYRGDRRNDGLMNLQIRTIRPDGTDDRALTDNQLFNWCPFWYRNGRSFIFTRVDHAARRKGKTPNYDLYMMDRRGRKLVRITYDTHFDGLPAFSSDGKRLMWTSQRGGLSEPQIFIADFTLPDAFR